MAKLGNYLFSLEFGVERELGPGEGEDLRIYRSAGIRDIGPPKNEAQYEVKRSQSDGARVAAEIPGKLYELIQ